MADFKAGVKATLKTGEIRNDYVKARFLAGATKPEILDEINSPERYNGPEGGRWEMTTVHAICKGLVPGGDEIESTAADAVERALGEVIESRKVDHETVELSDEELAEIRAKARASVHKEIKDRLMKEALAKETDKIRKEMAVDPLAGEAIVSVTIDLAPFAPYIQLDMPHGICYYHGQTYPVPRRIAVTLLEQMSRTWAHQESLAGNSDDFYRRRQNLRLSPRGITSLDGPRA